MVGSDVLPTFQVDDALHSHNSPPNSRPPLYCTTQVTRRPLWPATFERLGLKELCSNEEGHEDKGLENDSRSEDG